MKKLIGILTVAVVVIFLVLGIARTRQQEEVVTIAKIQESEGVPVLAAPVELGEVQLVRRYYGDILPQRQAVVSAKVGDRIERILVKVGQSVTQNQPLVQFDTTATVAAVTQKRLAAQNAATEAARIEALFNQGAVSRQALEAVQLARDIALENFETARASVWLLAPMDGRVASLAVTEGQYIHSGDPIMTIVAGDHLRTEFLVPAEDSRYIRPGQPFTASAPDGGAAKGVVTEVSATAADKGRQVKVFGRLETTGGLVPGMLAVIDLMIDSRSGVLTVPTDAVIVRNGVAAAVVVDGAVAAIVPVTVGLRGANSVEITGGLSEGQMVAVYGHRDLQDGVKVKIVAGI